MLGACRKYDDVVRAERVVAHLLSIHGVDDGCMAAAQVLLSNIYSTAGRYDGVAEVRDRMKAGSIRKESGSTTVVLPDHSID